MRKFLIIMLIVILLPACSSLQKKEMPLDYWNASSEGDYTALIRVCGEEIYSGHAYCRKNDGDSALADPIYFYAPPVSCSEASCVSVKIFNPAGKLLTTLAFPKGEKRVSASWMTLLNKSRFEVGDRGFWPFFYEIKFTDLEGVKHTLKTDGEIRLRVHGEAYLSLVDSPEDRFFVWQWEDEGQLIKMTTGGRTYVSPKGQK